MFNESPQGSTSPSPMSSTDERRVPKILLKINRSSIQETEKQRSESIYSSKAAEFVRVTNSQSTTSSIPLSIIVKRVNQNAYKSLENVLEL